MDTHKTGTDATIGGFTAFALMSHIASLRHTILKQTIATLSSTPLVCIIFHHSLSSHLAFRMNINPKENHLAFFFQLSIFVLFNHQTCILSHFYGFYPFYQNSLTHSQSFSLRLGELGGTRCGDRIPVVCPFWGSHVGPTVAPR